MALKPELETIEGLPEPVAKEYRAVDRGGKKVFILDIEGEDLPDEVPAKQALRKARDHEKNGRQSAEKQYKEASSRIEQLQNEIDEMRRGNIPKGDVEKLEKSWKERLEAKEKTLMEELATRDRTLQELLVDNVAQRMATEISSSPDLIIPHIKGRLKAEQNDGKWVTRVLDKEGKPSAMGIEELQKDITGDKRFAPIIIGTKASGGGASGGSGSGNGVPAVNFDPKTFDPNKATPTQLAQWSKYKAEMRASGGGKK